MVSITQPQFKNSHKPSLVQHTTTRRHQSMCQTQSIPCTSQPARRTHLAKCSKGHKSILLRGLKSLFSNSRGLVLDEDEALPRQVRVWRKIGNSHEPKARINKVNKHLSYQHKQQQTLLLIPGSLPLKTTNIVVTTNKTQLQRTTATNHSTNTRSDGTFAAAFVHSLVCSLRLTHVAFNIKQGNPPPKNKD